MQSDMSPDREILQSQESIAHALGVRRQGIAADAVRLREENAICDSRGRITVLDREKLRVSTCECYAHVRRKRHTLLPREVAT